MITHPSLFPIFFPKFFFLNHVFVWPLSSFADELRRHICERIPRDIKRNYAVSYHITWISYVFPEGITLNPYNWDQINLSSIILYFQITTGFYCFGFLLNPCKAHLLILYIWLLLCMNTDKTKFNLNKEMWLLIDMI